MGQTTTCGMGHTGFEVHDGHVFRRVAEDYDSKRHSTHIDTERKDFTALVWN